MTRPFQRLILSTILLGLLMLTREAAVGATLYGVSGRGGSPSATLHVISQTDASATPVLPLNDNNGGQVIAYNPDDGFLYHWTGWPASNTLFEKIDLSTNTVTNIPQSGYQTSEIYSATYDRLTGTFLTTDVNKNLTRVTTAGFRTYIGTTDRWVRGLAFVGETLYGGHNSLIPVNELYTIDPANGDFLSTTPVTLEGYTVASFSAQATHPGTGELWAVLMVLELPKKTRLLTKIDPATGVATLVGILPEDLGISSIAFVPDPVTFESTAEDIAHGLAVDSIDNSGIANSLLAKLAAARDAADRGQPATAMEILTAFVQAVEAQAGRHISRDMADLLLADAQSLAESLANDS